MYTSRSKALLLGVMVLGSYAASAQHQQHHGDSAMHGSHHMLYNPTDSAMRWMPGPPFLPAGVKMSVLEGDPSKEGPFTVRLQMPANYTIPPHTHPTIEHVTVIEGSAYFGMGNTLNRGAAKQLKRGGYAVLPANMAHYAFSKSRAVVQVHGMGPFAITYINPADDPRNKH